MATNFKPLFRPETLRDKLRSFSLSPQHDAAREKLVRQARFLHSPRARRSKESTLFPAFFADVFGELLGYVQPAQADSGPAAAPVYTLFPNFTTPKGELADAAIGHNPTQGDPRTVTAAVEMKGPTDPLDIPHAGRRLSAVEQAYNYAIDVPCDWIVVSSMVETRLYSKRTDRLSCERFFIDRLADPSDDSQLRKFVYLLGAERVVPTAPGQRSHLDTLLDASRATGQRVTNDFYAHYASMREFAFGQLVAANPAVPRPDLLAATQKLLDRILFCAFSEDRGLLPENSIARAFQHIDPYSLDQRPVWHNFRALFRSIDQGNSTLGISRYNGGLFAPDAILDQQLIVPDAVCDVFRRLGEYEYGVFDSADRNFPDDPAPPAFLDVEILGHIFEQSITDLERFQQRLQDVGSAQAATVSTTEAAAESVAAIAAFPAPSKTKTRRKKEGAFYTPSYITHFIVQHALGSVLRDRFEAIRARRHAAATGTAPAVLKDPRTYDLEALNTPQREALLLFWSDWRDELGRIRILDPACGSGAFLIEAFDQLYAEYQAANAHYDRLTPGLAGQSEFSDLNRLILQQNLYGVDLNPEAVEICRLSLWIKTAEKGKILADLDNSIKIGNSLIDDEMFAPGRPFNWQAAFRNVFTDGGFDVVVGNPPYIRQEWIAPLKPYLQRNYKVYSGTADLYLYFVEKGLNVLRPGGRLGFVTSGTFTSVASAAAFRSWLPQAAAMEAVVNLGDTQPFGPDVWAESPTITLLKKGNSTTSFPYLFLGEEPNQDLSHHLASDAQECDAHCLSQKEWRFQPRAVTELFSRLMATGRPLREGCNGRLYYGIKTGLNEAFIIDAPTRERLVTQNPRSEDILKKVLKGEDLRPWYQEWDGRWLILIPCGTTLAAAGDLTEAAGWAWFSATYPAIADYLYPFREAASKRSDQGNYWWELRACDYYTEFNQPKILWPDIAKLPRFSWDTAQFYLGNTGYILVPEAPWVLAVLQTRVVWFCISQLAPNLGVRAGLTRFRCIDGPLNPDAPNQEKLSRLALLATEVARERCALHARIRHRIQSDLAPAGATLNNALSTWWTLEFRTFRAELKKAWKGNIPLPERDAWETHLTTWRTEHETLTRRLIDIESEINDRTYRLFKLTSQDVHTLVDFQRQTRTFYTLGEI